MATATDSVAKMAKPMTELEKRTPTDKNPKKEFEKMVKHYLDSNPMIMKNMKIAEMEVRFGTGKNVKKITKIDYDNVVSALYSSGFQCFNTDGLYSLRIANEYLDQTGAMRISNIRAEIEGVDLIQEYCRTNSLQKLLDDQTVKNDVLERIRFTHKTPVSVDGGAYAKSGETFAPVKFDDFGFNVSYKMEQIYDQHSMVAKEILAKWNDSKKIFRHMNRVQFTHPDFPIKADLSIVRTSKANQKKFGGQYIPEYTIQDANVFLNEPSYEVELEIDNEKVGSLTAYDTADKLLACIRKVIRYIISALQGTSYPISFVEQARVKNEYMEVLFEDAWTKKEEREKRIVPKNFIGPSSVTLQMVNVMNTAENAAADMRAPNIREGYCVTDKADGDRRLLFINGEGRMYLLTPTMDVVFTGALTENKELFNTIIDGEHIKYNKKGEYINAYAAFDIYYRAGKSVREYPFIYRETATVEDGNAKYRYLLLRKCVDILNPKSITEGATKSACHFQVRCKNFYAANSEQSIFECCSAILTDIDSSLYEYNTDGLIFTPVEQGVGGMKAGEAGNLSKITWGLSFKWKPAEYNTIDFLVSVRKDKAGKDEVHNIVQEGVSLSNAIQQYKTLVLRCGYNRERDGFLDAFNELLKYDADKEYRRETAKDKYQPAPFIPTAPYDANAYLCNVMLHNDGTGNMFMKTEEGDYFEEHTIVEFKYEMSKDHDWRWVPIRVRYDKTAELRQGLQNYGNSYGVANENWKSIHNPITEHMIKTGEDIPDFEFLDDVYYASRNEESNTRALRNFHNRYVKHMLISSVSNRGDALIDMAVGKAGDLPKWIDAKLKFVFGIDVAKDNIQNSVDGACARYLINTRYSRKLPGALFAVGNSALNIREGKAFPTDKDKMVSNAVFGVGAKDADTLGKNVYDNYGVAAKGFNVTSCQFAIHYFFENATTFHGFMRNVVECTRLGGYFVGTCFDGLTVFNRLKNKAKDEMDEIYLGGKRVFSVRKMYDQTGFPEDEQSLGYGIDVYQETINQTFREYLVNFEFLKRTMENYGFVLVDNKDAHNMGLPAGSAMFRALFENMMRELKINPEKAKNYGEAAKMCEEEKQISFMNRYFVFKKVRDVSTENIKKLHRLLEREVLDEEDAVPELKQLPEEQVPKQKERGFIRKVSKNRKIKI